MIAPPAPKRGEFLVMVDGKPVARSPHGQSIDWFGTSL
jgi:hypothetical protein